MYKLIFKESFISDYKKFIRNNLSLEKKFEKALSLLSKDPIYPSLRSHKVDTKDFDNVWSSWVTGDIRIIWMYEDEVLVIVLLAIGKHSGGKKIYK